MPPYKRYAKRRYTRRGTSRRRYTRSLRSNARLAYKALRIARKTSRRVAGEVCKFESTPAMYRGLTITGTTGPTWTNSYSNLLQINSGDSWVMPINWFYQTPDITGVDNRNAYIEGQQVAVNIGSSYDLSLKFPIYYNTIDGYTDTDTSSPAGDYMMDNIMTTELQYRLKYLYINGVFNAGATGDNNQDGLLRVVIVKDKQPTAGAATWYDIQTNRENLQNTIFNSRSVFNSNRIDAQLNPHSLGRFKIMYDKTLRFNTTNGYKPFKYYKALSTTVRNNKNINSNGAQNETPYVPGNNFSTKYGPTPVQKNAYYLMIFSDGLNFTYTNSGSTDNGQFHLFSRVAYYNN